MRNATGLQSVVVVVVVVVDVGVVNIVVFVGCSDQNANYQCRENIFQLMSFEIDDGK